MSKSILTQTAILASKARDNIDTELMRIKDYLESTGLGYRGSLIDKDGFPLPDVDHYKILQERQHAARLLNDRKRVEYILDQLTQTETSEGDAVQPLFVDLEKLHPMAFVDEVHQKSPAEKGGLVNGDFILKFGAAKGLQDLPKIIVEGAAVTVTVLRVDRTGRNIIELKITPERWEGNGLVGAHLLPYSN